MYLFHVTIFWLVLVQQNIPHYQTPSNSCNHKDDVESHEMPMYLNTTRKNHSAQDYEAIPGPETYGSAAHVYYNCVGGSISYDDSTLPEYSKLEPINKSVAVNDEEEVFSDPGSSLAEIYVCFEKKKICMIKYNDIRYPTSS